MGLGKLGLPFVAACASKNLIVYGFDINGQIITKLQNGFTFLKETQLQNLIKKFKSNIYPTTDINEAVVNSDITFIITPTPSLNNGLFSLKFINSAINNLTKPLKIKDKYHLIVIVSTVMPGATNQIRERLEKYTGKVCGKDFGLCYNPEFIALGRVISDLLNADFILIGEFDKRAGDMLEKFYRKFCNNRPKIARMNFINAEISKIAVNTFITTKISYANMLAEICEKLPGGNVDIVTQTLGLDTRIGKKYLRGGPSFGGPCFPRDNIAFINLAKSLNSSFQIPLATHHTNLQQIQRLFKKIIKLIPNNENNKTVAILGLAYKPFTDVIEESTGLFLSKLLIKKNIRVHLHDPLALENTKKILGDKKNIKYFKNLKDCISSSDIIVITTNWQEYKNIKTSWLENGKKIIIDSWRMIDSKKLTKNCTYLPLGLNTI